MHLMYSILHKSKDSDGRIVRDYEVTSEALARHDHENGHYALCNSAEERITSWHLCITDFTKEAAKTNNPLEDRLGHLLAIGDIVMSEDGLGRVVGFTPARIMVYSLTYASYKASPRHSHALVRLVPEFF